MTDVFQTLEYEDLDCLHKKVSWGQDPRLHTKFICVFFSYKRPCSLHILAMYMKYKFQAAAYVELGTFGIETFNPTLRFRKCTCVSLIGGKYMPINFHATARH